MTFPSKSNNHPDGTDADDLIDGEDRFEDVKKFGLCAVPKNRRSKWPGRRRKYINWLKKDSVKPIHYEECRECGAPIKPDHVCLQCFAGPPRRAPMFWNEQCKQGN